MADKFKLSLIDSLLLKDHYYLDKNDLCIFYGEFNAKTEASYSKTNQLIYNFKKPMDQKGTPSWGYKGQAIKEIAGIILNLDAWEILKSATWIPIPPSKNKGDPLYDDRLIQVLQLLKSSYQYFDYRELVIQTNSRSAAHKSDSRPTPSEHYENFQIDQLLTQPEPKQIVIFDDIITTGSQFKAMKRILSENYPNKQIIGVFIARVRRNAEPNIDNL